MDVDITPDPTQGKILCCECGVPIDPNPANTCIACIRARNDISEGIPKQGTLCFCKGCERYLDPPSSWLLASLESKELLRICLKKMKGLNQVRLIDAGFAWTEPHSKRIKVKLSVQKEIQEGAILQQEFIVEYIVVYQMCDDCHRIEAKDYWRALVQVRQKADHKRTFYYLEQLILKHKVHDNTLGIQAVSGGLDFFYSGEQGARRMIDFLTSVVPCKWHHSKKLISHDIHSNTFNYKHTFCVEIVPICKDSVVCLSPSLAHQYGGIGQVCVIHRITNNIIVMNPDTAQFGEISSSTYYKSPFGSLCTSKGLAEFVVMDCELIQAKQFKGQGQVSKRHKVAEVWVQRTSDLGKDEMIFCRSHLGHILNPGDSVLGFDMRNSNVNDDHLDKLKDWNIPDVVLVKKIYADKSTRNRRRIWKLKHLELQDDGKSQNTDYMDFLEDLEEDPQLRTNINIYKSKKECPPDLEDSDMLPDIALDELIDEFEKI